MMEKAASRPIVPTVEEEVAERVWAQQTIPMKAEEIVHFERDHERLVGGTGGVETELGLYRRIAGLNVGEEREGGVGGADRVDGGGSDGDSGSNGDGNTDDNDESDVDSSDADEEMWEERTKLTKEQVRELRRANKKEVKEANAERRKTKIKKAVKKKAVKKGNKKK